MVISVASYKGGVGKTVTAVHLAAYFQHIGTTLLLDSDANKASVAWAAIGKLPFRTMPFKGGARLIGQYDYTVLDTEARPEEGDIKELAEGCDLLVIPTCPDAISMRVLEQTVQRLAKCAQRELSCFAYHRSTETESRWRGRSRILDGAGNPAIQDRHSANCSVPSSCPGRRYGR